MKKKDITPLSKKHYNSSILDWFLGWNRVLYLLAIHPIQLCHITTALQLTTRHSEFLIRLNVTETTRVCSGESHFDFFVTILITVDDLD